MVYIEDYTRFNTKINLSQHSLYDMKRKLISILVLFLMISCNNAEIQDSDVSQLYDNSEQFDIPMNVVEAQSLLGEGLVRPDFDDETTSRLTNDLIDAINRFNVAPDDPNSIIWVARRTAYLWRYQDAIYILTDGINENPNNPRFYRHRGHRYITIREFDKAIDDLLKGIALIQGQDDEIEVDGAPNDANIPVSTLHFNLYYHLGVAYYLNGNFDFAVDAFENSFRVSRNNDTRVSTIDWLYMSYLRNGNTHKAQNLINDFDTEIEVLESHSYLNRIRLYKGLITPDDLLNQENMNTLNLLTQGYGVAMWYYHTGKAEKAITILNDIIETNYWAAFGYIAAEAEIARLK
jgi:tetratricopeptide (TPR) repeat protein